MFGKVRPEFVSDITTRSFNFGIKTIFSLGRYNIWLSPTYTIKRTQYYIKTINNPYV